MKRKTIIIAAGVLLAAGAVAAVAQGHRGGWRGEGEGPGMGQGIGGMESGGGRGGRDDMRGRWWRGGSLTQSEHDARTRERFARLDANSDGVVDQAEIEAAFTRRMSRWGRDRGGDGAGRGERMIRRFDGNKDGKVTREEFLNASRKMFGEMDLTNDDRIDDSDLPPMMRGRNALSEGGGAGRGHGGGMGEGGMGFGGPMSFLRQADANKDGVVTLEEAMAEAGKMFARLDRTKDNVVDKADFDALGKETADYRVKRFIHHFGGDKDGKVTREQFDKVAKERFAMRDLNNDGTISRDEFGRGWGRGRGGEGGEGRGEQRGRGPMMGPGSERGQGPGAGPGQGPGLGRN